MLKVDSKHWRAHRMSYAVHGGDLYPNLVIMHSCDNPRCVNPAHLRQGTQAENTAEMILKGRGCYHRAPRGEAQGHAKLTDALVMEIRERYERENLSQRELAIHYGVATITIHYVIVGKLWSHLPVLHIVKGPQNFHDLRRRIYRETSAYGGYPRSPRRVSHNVRVMFNPPLCSLVTC